MSTTIRPPPSDIEAERGLLGAILQGGENAAELVSESVGPWTSAFYHPAHQAIFAVMQELIEEGKPVDSITVSDRLRGIGKLEDVGGYAYMAVLEGACPAPSNAPYYGGIVRDAFILRQIIRAGTEAAASAYDANGTAPLELLDAAENAILSIRSRQEGNGRGETLLSAGDVAKLAVKRAEAMFERGYQPSVKTGLENLDRLLLMEPGNLVIIAARPSVGKTALGCCVALNNALEGRPAGIVSLEMNAESISLRLLSSLARVNPRDFSRGMTQEDLSRYRGAVGQFPQLALCLDAVSDVSVLDVRSQIRRMLQRHNVRLVVVDYLQLIRASGRTDNREQEVAQVCRSLKSVASSLGIVVMLLAQLNRDCERGTTPRKPRLSDIRESGATEQDSDAVVFLHPEADPERSDQNEVTAIVAKQRNGPTGEAKLVFRKWCTLFESAPAITAADAPAIE